MSSKNKNIKPKSNKKPTKPATKEAEEVVDKNLIEDNVEEQVENNVQKPSEGKQEEGSKRKKRNPAPKPSTADELETAVKEAIEKNIQLRQQITENNHLLQLLLKMVVKFKKEKDELDAKKKNRKKNSNGPPFQKVNPLLLEFMQDEELSQYLEKEAAKRNDEDGNPKKYSGPNENGEVTRSLAYSAVTGYIRYNNLKKEKGKVDFDDKLNELFPDLANKVDTDEGVTYRMIMSSLSQHFPKKKEKNEA